MDKDQAEELIHEYAIDRGGQYGVLVPEENFRELAGAIAQAHEEEVANLKTERMELQTQVMVSGLREVVMALTLKYIKKHWWDKHYPPDVFVGGSDSDDGVNEIVAIREMIEEDLSAAPRVLHGLRGTLFAEGVDYGPRGAANYGDLVVLPKEGLETRVETVSDIDGRKATYLERHRHYQEVDILVLAHEPGDANYQQAKGAIPWHEGNELPENTIARLRGRAVAEPRQPSDSAEERQQDG